MSSAWSSSGASLARLMAVVVIVAACGTATTTVSPPATSPRPTTSPPSATIAPTTAPSPTLELSAASPIPGAIGEALAYLGPVPQRIRFIDWTAIRAATGSDDLTSASPFAEKTAALRNDAPPTVFARTLQNAEVLGFDVFDLAWEAWSYAPERGDVIVARLRDGVDSSVLSARLDEAGFATESLAHGVLRTATPDASSVLWMTGPLALQNTAVLDDRRTIVLAYQSPEVPRAVLTDGPTPIVDLSLRSVARLLDAPTVASLVAGDQCRYVKSKIEALPAEAQSSALAALDTAGPLGHFNVVAYGYDWTDDPIGRFVFGYADEQSAHGDLDGRALLAREGTSLGWGSPASSGTPYADRLFALVDARTEERSIVLRVGPVPFELRSPDPANPSLRTNLLPFTLQQMFEFGDMLFAACSE